MKVGLKKVAIDAQILLNRSVNMLFFISKRKLDKLIVESIRDILINQKTSFTIEEKEFELRNLQQQKGAITSLLALREKIGTDKTLI